ncbi:hypothetical protein MRX96_005966 [Rhipicephalus microplus]
MTFLPLTSSVRNDDVRATERSLTLRQRGRQLALNSVAFKQPRLPNNALRLIVCPRGRLLLSKITNFQLFEVVCAAENFPKASNCGEDLIEVNPKRTHSAIVPRPSNELNGYCDLRSW